MRLTPKRRAASTCCLIVVNSISARIEDSAVSKTFQAGLVFLAVGKQPERSRIEVDISQRVECEESLFKPLIFLSVLWFPQLFTEVEVLSDGVSFLAICEVTLREAKNE